MDKKYWIIKLLTGNISSEEKEDYLKEVEKNHNKKTEYLKYLNLWKLTSMGDSPASFPERNKQFEKFWSRKIRSARVMVIMRNSLRYAAIFVAAVCLVGLVQYITGSSLFSGKESAGHDYKLETNYGSISRIQLEDGSRIWLNTHSTMHITEMKENCLVQLKGEAFFDIIHNEKRTFQINLGDFVIIDRGTHFNITAYPEDSIARTVILEGKIEVRNQINNSTLSLNAGEGYVYNKNSKADDLIQVDGSIESSWKDGKFVFIDKSLRQICDNLGKWYNVDFVYNDQALAETRYTCTLKRTTTINQIMKILNSISDIDYEIINSANGSKDIIILK
jgi:ferric-dicitrate binding protein FerR (iron transport regulator)